MEMARKIIFCRLVFSINEEGEVMIKLMVTKLFLVVLYPFYQVFLTVIVATKAMVFDF